MCWLICSSTVKRQTSNFGKPADDVTQSLANDVSTESEIKSNPYEELIIVARHPCNGSRDGSLRFSHSSLSFSRQNDGTLADDEGEKKTRKETEGAEDRSVVSVVW